MPNHAVRAPHPEEELSLPLFFTTVVLSLASLYGLLWFLAPQSVWLHQVGAAAWKFAAAFLIIKLLNCFMEFFFHRYVLHKPVVPFLNREEP